MQCWLACLATFNNWTLSGTCNSMESYVLATYSPSPSCKPCFRSFMLLITKNSLRFIFYLIILVSCYSCCCRLKHKHQTEINTERVHLWMTPSETFWECYSPAPTPKIITRVLSAFLKLFVTAKTCGFKLIKNQI